MIPQKLADHFRKEAAYYQAESMRLMRTHPFQSLAGCPGCDRGTRGGSLCPEFHTHTTPSRPPLAKIPGAQGLKASAHTAQPVREGER